MARLLVQHNTISFNNFISKDLPIIISELRNPIRILKNKEGDEYKTKVYFYVGGENGISIRYETPKKNPNDCRLDGHTYFGKLIANVDIVVNHNNREVKTNHEITLCDIPTMLHSEYCKLSKLSSDELSSIGESRYERGGYFIIKGSEKIILSQEDSAKNIIYTHVDNIKGNLLASIHSGYGSRLPERFDLTLNRKDKTINATIPFLKSSIPLMLLFKALGLETDKQILNCICGGDLSSNISKLLCNYLIPSIDELDNIYSQEIALRTISILTKVQASGIEKVNKNIKWKGNLLYILNKRFLPHIYCESDDYILSLNKKSHFLGYMVRHLILTELGYKKLTDRDSLIYKSVRLPGHILNEMFREFYEEYLSNIKNETDKMLQMDKKSKDNITEKTILEDILSNSNKIFDNTAFQKNIDRSFNGNWGMNPTSPRNEGVLQTYLRHSFMEAMSHLRRVHLYLTDGPNTMEQRRLHNSQWGYFCPVETSQFSMGIFLSSRNT